MHVYNYRKMSVLVLVPPLFVLVETYETLHEKQMPVFSNMGRVMDFSKSLENGGEI